MQAGTITIRVGNPHDTEPWEWTASIPARNRAKIQSGTSATFEDARAEFASAWKIFFANRTDADFQAWRYQRDFTAWEYTMWDRGFKLPTQLPSGRSQCFCGAELTISGVTDHIPTAHRLAGQSRSRFIEGFDTMFVALTKPHGNGTFTLRMKMRRALAAWKRANTQQSGPVKTPSINGLNAQIRGKQKAKRFLAWRKRNDRR